MAGKDFNESMDMLSSLLTSVREDAGIFERTPVDLDTFLYNKAYLGLPPLSETQFAFVEAASEIYPPCKYTECVAEWGKGSGKDFCCMITLARVVYMLECLYNPATFYSLKDGSYIDTLNIATNSSQASDIFFEPFKEMIKSSPIFQEIGFSIHPGMIVFPKHVRAISGHSEMEGLEGYNLILAILDEIDAFKTADEVRNKGKRAKSAQFIYDRMMSSTQSRFPGIGKVCSISFPRFNGSFIQQRRLLGLNDYRTFVSAAEGVPTWIANPIRKREDFNDEYRKDPERAKMMYECKPPFARDAFIKHPEFVYKAFHAKVEEGLLTYDRENTKPIIEVIDNHLPVLFKPALGANYRIHIDLGLSNDRCGFAMAHYDGEKVFVDLMAVYNPPAGGEIQFQDVRELIDQIVSRDFQISKITLDGWQSADTIQQLRNRGINAEVVLITKQIYDTLKDVIYIGKLDGYYNDIVIEELLGLELVAGKKVDHKSSGSKDLADAVAGAVFGAIQDGENLPTITIIEDEGKTSSGSKESFFADRELTEHEWVLSTLMRKGIGINAIEEENNEHMGQVLTEEKEAS